MIRFSKVIARIIIFTLVCLIPIILYVAFFKVDDSDFKHDSSVSQNWEQVVEKNIDHGDKFVEQEFKNEIKVVNIDLKTTSLIIKKGPTFRIDSNLDLEVNQNADELNIEDKDLSKVSGQLILTFDENKPLSILRIKNDSGVVKVFSINVANLELNQGAGAVVFENLNVTDSAKINGGLASLNFKNVTLNNAEILLGTGSLNYVGKFSGVSSISNSVGSVFVKLKDGFDNYHFDVVYGSGKVLFRNNHITSDWQSGSGKNLIKFQTGIGAVIVK